MGHYESRAATFEVVSGTARRLAAEATSVDDASRQLPRGAYTTLRTYGGRRVVRLDQHLSRLEESVAPQGTGGQIDRRGLRRGVAGILALQPGESRLRITFAPPRLFVSVEPFEPLPTRLYKEGVRCATVAARRDDPHAKDTAFLATAQRTRDALSAGVHEGLLLDEEGRILEGLSSNFFAVLGGVLRTERDRVLKGVTRSLVLEAATTVLLLDERPVSTADLPAVSEVFITSVSREILPVVEIDGVRLGSGRPGPVTTRLMDGLRDLIDHEAETVA